MRLGEGRAACQQPSSVARYNLELHFGPTTNKPLALAGTHAHNQPEPTVAH